MTVGADRGSYIDERADLLKLARSNDRKQSLAGAFAIAAARAEDDLSPDDGRSKPSLGKVIRRLDALFGNEREEMLMMLDQRACQVPYLFVGRVDVLVRQGVQRLRESLRRVEQLRTRERPTPS